ncbi:MAG: O-antigen ligase family protein [Luteolibacter sp.]
MAISASAFLVLSLWLAVVVGPQMRTWPWGPALIALAAALGCAAIAAIRAKRPLLDPGTLTLGGGITGWFAWRAWTSPVAELAHADLLLLGAAVGGFLVVRSIAHDRKAESVFLWGMAALLAASLGMIFLQLNDPGFSQFRSIPSGWASGFYAHYNEGANFLIGAGFLLLGGAIFGRQHKAVRLLWLLIAILSLAAVWFTRSRGAIFGVIVGLAALTALILVIGSKRKAGWFAPAMIAFPVVLLASGFALVFGWEKIQRVRSDGNQGVVQMMDNTSRLRNYSLTYDAIMLSPMVGSGSRSYSWTSFQVWRPKEHGLGGTLPEQTHNEILQAATDYGLLGAGGILTLLAWLTLCGIWHSKFDEENLKKTSVSADALRLGGMAALAGMLVQSSFSFVFHLMPGAMLLGIALGRLASPGSPTAPTPRLGRTGQFAVAILALAIAAAILAPGIAGTRATLALIPVYHPIGPVPDRNERLARFTRAINAWPQSDLHLSRAMIHHGRLLDGENAALEPALSDYLAAARHNPKFPAHFVNAANLHSLAEEAEQAEALYRKAIELQGNMEPAFRAHFHLASHQLRVGSVLLRAGNPAAAVAAMESALANIHELEKKSAWLSQDARDLRNTVHLALATAQEVAGDPQAARDTLDTLLKIPGGNRYQYYRGMLEFRHAMAVWRKRQPATALPMFQNARNHLAAARNHPPQGISRETIQQRMAETDEVLKLLHDAGFRAP